MKSLMCLGEGLAELRLDESGALINSIAGDTLNAAVYAKRYDDVLKVAFASAVGQEFLSDNLYELLEQEQLESQYVLRSEVANIGIYAIQTDEQGERSFKYWRKESAYTSYLQLLEAKGGALSLKDHDIIFFSGISVATLSDENKSKLFELLAVLKQKGAKIAFDPNYRPVLWKSTSHAVTWLEKAYALSDIVLPGLDEHHELLGHSTVEEVQTYFEQFSVEELVIKSGDDGVTVFDSLGNRWHQPFRPAEQQVDSTAAGDSFAGTYLASRLMGAEIQDALYNADSVARVVVQHKGAIIPRGACEEALSSARSSIS